MALSPFYPLFFALQFAVAAGVLALASYQDIKERLVSDAIWIAGAVLGAILHIIGIWIAEAYGWRELLLNFCLGAGIVGVLSLPKIWGGEFLMGPADLLGILAIAFIAPLHSPLVFYYNINLFRMPVLFTILVNAFLLLGVFIGANLTKNFFLFASARKKNRLRGNSSIPVQISDPGFTWFGEFPPALALPVKMLYFLLGRRISVDRLSRLRFVQLLEDFDEETTVWRPSFSLGFSNEIDPKDIAQVQEGLIELNLSHIWVSPLLPLVVFFFLGLILATLWGNVLFHLFEFIL